MVDLKNPKTKNLFSSYPFDSLKAAKHIIYSVFQLCLFVRLESY